MMWHSMFALWVSIALVTSAVIDPISSTARPLRITTRYPQPNNAASTTKSTAAPTADPTAAPTADPTAAPTADPTAAPAAVPSDVPGVDPVLYSVMGDGLLDTVDDVLEGIQLMQEEPVFEAEDTSFADDIMEQLKDQAVLDDDFTDDVDDDQYFTNEEGPDSDVYDTDDVDEKYFTDEEDSDEYEDEDTSNIIIDGIYLAELTPEEIYVLLEDVDSDFVSELDKDMLRDLAAYRKAWSEVDAATSAVDNAPIRRKRAIPLLAGLAARAAFAGARALFRGAARGGLSRSGTRLTRQYTKPGGLNAAMRDFNRLGIQNSKSFGGKVSGRTGTVGRHRVTVRDGSSSGAPTLEIRTPKAGGEFVRKFRYPK